MDVRVVRYSLGRQGTEVAGQVVNAAGLQPLTNQRVVAPAVFLVSMSVVDSLVAQACLVDRGVKAKEIELARYLLHVSGTPLIRASYASPRRLTNSLSSLLDGALKAGERKVYVVAVDDDLLEPQWRAAQRAELLTADPGPLPPPPPPPTQRAAPPATQAAPSFLPPSEFAGPSAGAVRVRQAIAEQAGKPGPVLIRGNPGSGRILVAELLHRSGKRADRPFLQCRCRGVPLAEQSRQLFGVPRGSLVVPGALQLAHSGTLVIQDFEWLPISLQTQLVEACLGPRATLDVRLLFISSLTIAELVARGRVDPTLAAQLTQAEIAIPSLSERPEDTPIIAAQMWRRITFNGAPLPAEIMDELRTQIFPNEADELYDVLVRLFVRGSEGRFTKGHFLSALHDSRSARATYASPAGELFGVELDPKPQYAAHLEKLANTLRDLWIAFRPIRQGYQAATSTVVATIPDVDAHLNRLERLCREPFRFVNATLYHNVLEFKGEMMALRDAAAAEPGEIGRRWELEFKQRLEQLYHLLNAALFAARDQLRGDGPDRQ